MNLHWDQKRGNLIERVNGLHFLLALDLLALDLCQLHEKETARCTLFLDTS